ncbi:MAG: transposase [Deltaproteobacteria bacterium]|nr:transposase [Deltaproteobacteria bacterium]
MPRISRGLADGFIYHVLNRGNGRQQVFNEDNEYECFIELMAEAKTMYEVRILAYCLMPNHFHLLLAPGKAEDMSKWMQWLMTSHVRRHHRNHRTSGHVWQGRFKSFIVQKDEHLLTVARYIEGNPVRARLVASAKDWIWSSHAERCKEPGNFLIDNLPIALPESWTEYVDVPIGYELEKLRKSVLRQSPFGADQWVSETCKELGLESTIREKGRPRKWD